MTQSHIHKDLKISDARSSENYPIANTLSCRGYILLGILLFMIFYWMIPDWLNHELITLQNNAIRPIAETLFVRRIYWIQLAGIALGLICAFFAIRNYLLTRSISKSGGNFKFFNRLCAKIID
jgi:hypothetical protein